MVEVTGEVSGIVNHDISNRGGREGQLLSEGLADLFNLPPMTVGFMVKTVAKGLPGEEMGRRDAAKIRDHMPRLNGKVP